MHRRHLPASSASHLAEIVVAAGDRGEPPKPNVAKSIDPPNPNRTRTIEPPPQSQASTGMSIQGSSAQQLVLAAHTAGLPTHSTDSKASDRKELPAGFFTSLYPPIAPAMPGWQRAPQFLNGICHAVPCWNGCCAPNVVQRRGSRDCHCVYLLRIELFLHSVSLT